MDLFFTAEENSANHFQPNFVLDHPRLKSLLNQIYHTWSQFLQKYFLNIVRGNEIL